MFGFFKRRDEGVTPVAPGTPVDMVSFTSREVFAILGDVDACYFICNTTTMELLRPALVCPDEWRRRAVERLAPAGIVDDACNPCPELERLLEPLRERGVEITDGVVPRPRDRRDKRSFCLAATRGHATLVRSTGVGCDRTFLLSDAGPRERWWSAIASSAHVPSVTPASPPERVYFLDSDPTGENFSEALIEADADCLRAFAERWGADYGRLVGTSTIIAAAKMDQKGASYLYLLDTTDGEVDYVRSKNFTMHKPIGGNLYAAEMAYFPFFGFAVTGWCSRRQGMSPDWFSNDDERRAATFGSIDWLGDGDLVAHLMSNPPFPEHLTTPWRPAGGE